MALDNNLIGLAVGKVQAENRGLQPPESTRIGVISALMPNPIMSLVISRSLADKAVASLPPAPAPPVVTGGGTVGPDTGGTPQTRFERSVKEALASMRDEIRELRREVADLRSRIPRSKLVPRGQAAPPGPVLEKEGSGKPPKGGGTS